MPDQSSAATEHAILQEITAPLATLPDDPVALVNADFPVALRGYDRMAVDAYVQEVSQLVAELQATRSPEAAVRRALERVGEQISGILRRAHETAEQITAQSRSEAEERLMQARAEAAEIAGAAEQRVNDLDADTERIWAERQRIVDDARDLASQLLAVAETAGQRFPEGEAPEETAVTAVYDDADEDLATEPAPPLAEDVATEPAQHLAEEDVAEPEADAGGEDPTAVFADPTAVFAAPPTEEGEAEPASPEAEADPPDEQPPSQRARRSRSVIPPASQAANRRTDR